MHYTRNMACALAAIDVQQFKTLDRRDQLAIRDRADLGEDDQRWPRITGREVVMLAAQARLIEGYDNVRGLAPDTAKMIVRNVADFVAEVLATGGPADAWLGYVSKPQDGQHIGGHVTGTLTDVCRQIEADGPTASRVYLLNLSGIIREVRERAVGFGVAFA